VIYVTHVIEYAYRLTALQLAADNGHVTDKHQALMQPTCLESLSTFNARLRALRRTPYAEKFVDREHWLTYLIGKRAIRGSELSGEARYTERRVTHAYDRRILSDILPIFQHARVPGRFPVNYVEPNFS
jgi:hypothetical protein